jgi:hypothetical protein
MEGVTTAITVFIFACLIWPDIVKNKPQFYSSIGLLMVIILFDAIGHMSSGGPLFHVMYVLAAILQMLTILILVMCVGGLSPRELASEVSETIDAIRHGGEQKPVLVPLKGEQPIPKEPEPPPRQTITLNDADNSIPLE